MKYIVSLKSAQKAPFGFDTPEQAVADFLLTCSNITPAAVIEEMKRRIKKTNGKTFRPRLISPRPVLCVETGVVYESVFLAKTAHGEGLGKALKTGQAFKGLHFKYADGKK